ncbi:hypothetical protein HJG54_35260 (plasmid) [Leptolyngbya sp. NK1-12]|uniref:Uncharacterized protein n=1 Tax=Leptolyngbya sp. NK1-12 TaxID=2547451 RepID=A0AA96WMR2_9CYAN|nr:hypothetical protein [Leptolyngbya sp. NK1-12]WNZ28174.1 hypothetical protein HJG54_35260 [Leptolyngbya sp. NK1-12]
MTLAEIALLVGVAGGVAGLISVLAKPTFYLSNLKREIESLKDSQARQQADFDHEIEKLQLVMNGVRERVEHINTRVSGQLKEQAGTLSDLENWLTKNTSYERRRSGS